MPTEALEIVNRLESIFSFVIDEIISSEVGIVVVRSDISDPKGASLFVEELEKITNSRFVLSRKVNIKPLIPLVYHKHWICQYSASEKCAKKGCSVICKASVEILIKKVDKNTIEEDKFLKLDNPLPCIIKLYLVHTHCNHASETGKASVIRKDVVPRLVQVSSTSDKLHESHSEEECTDEIKQTHSSSSTVLNVKTKVSKRKQSSSPVHQIAKKEKKDRNYSEDNLNADDNVQDKFSYIDLTGHLDQVQKPNARWTVAVCQEYVICVKWDTEFLSELKVVVCQDLAAKVFLREEEVPSLGIKIHSVENLSSLLLAVNELDISDYADSEDS